MHAKHPPIHNRPQREIIKHITAISPYIATSVFPLTLVVESIHLGDLPRLVIAADECYSIGISDFEEEKEEECFDGVEASVDKVACGECQLDSIWEDRKWSETKMGICDPARTSRYPSGLEAGHVANGTKTYRGLPSGSVDKQISQGILVPSRWQPARPRLTHKDILRPRTITSDFEKLHKIKELAMYIPTYLVRVSYVDIECRIPEDSGSDL